ncbi:MAG: hypothetical protein RSA00_06080 [Hydrogenoanaerobacterium sp.]
MEIKEFDTVVLKDGRMADIMDVSSPETYVADIGSSPKDWEQYSTHRRWSCAK